MPLLWWTRDNSRDIPQWAYSHLVTRLGVAHEALSDLKCFERRDLVNGTPSVLIRIFNPEEARNAGVRDFTSLDRHPELIQWEGWQDPATGAVFMEQKSYMSP